MEPSKLPAGLPDFRAATQTCPGVAFREVEHLYPGTIFSGIHRAHSTPLLEYPGCSQVRACDASALLLWELGARPPHAHAETSDDPLMCHAHPRATTASPHRNHLLAAERPCARSI